mgnify:CR=1 FL=1
MTIRMASFRGSVLERDSFCYKIKGGDKCTWMCIVPEGDGELESESQGWSRDSSFAQEAGAKIQSQSRIDGVPSLLGKVQDVRKFLTHLPSFFFFTKFRLVPIGMRNERT